DIGQLSDSTDTDEVDDVEMKSVSESDEYEIDDASEADDSDEWMRSRKRKRSEYVCRKRKYSEHVHHTQDPMPSTSAAVPVDEGASTFAAAPDEPVASTSTRAPYDPALSTSTTAPDDPVPFTSPASGTSQSHLLMKYTATKIIGHNGHFWSTKPLSDSTTRTASCNLMPVMDMSSARRHTFDPTQQICIQYFFSDELINEVKTCTNINIAQNVEKYSQKRATVDKATFSEIMALTGVLIFSSAQEHNHVSTD
ncbi:hypothetical protein SK128_013153, partial [Halocaridina rubra]